jgi:hypothetical protein
LTLSTAGDARAGRAWVAVTRRTPLTVAVCVPGTSFDVLRNVFSRRRQRPGTRGAEVHRPEDERAYLLLEEARTRCEALRMRADTTEERRRLGSLHRELGMAGFLASSDIPPQRRCALHRLARARSAQPAFVLSGEPAEALVALTLRAQAAIDRGLKVPALITHMRRARGYLGRAQERLEPVALAMFAAAGRELAGGTDC